MECFEPMNNIDDKPVLDSYWVIPGKFLAGAYPGSFDPIITRSRLTAYLNKRFDTFFDLTQTNELPPYNLILLEEASYQNLKVDYQRYSIQDKGIPSLDFMNNLLGAIDEKINSGHKIYLHCWGGIGRTGTTVGCYLVRHGSTGVIALQLLSKLYLTSAQSTRYPYSPETATQIDFIKNWHG
jgi:hypothetical protein